MNERFIETARGNFCDALLSGERNMTVRKNFAELIKRGDLYRNEETGRWSLYISNLGESWEPMALGVAAWDHYEHCNALVTHDLSTFRCWDVTELISEMRIS